MNNIAQAVWVEMLKARRSRMPLLTALGFSLLPLGGGFFMIVLKDPEMARRGRTPSRHTQNEHSVGAVHQDRKSTRLNSSHT